MKNASYDLKIQQKLFAITLSQNFIIFEGYIMCKIT